MVASTTGDLVKTCPLKLTLIAGGALLALPAFAHGPAQPGDAVAAAALVASASAPKSPTVTTKVATTASAAMPATVTKTVIATGNVLVLADGIVASAAIAQIHPPAPGFVYER